ANRREITLNSRNDLARKLFVRGHPLRVRVREALLHDVEPCLELLLTAWPDLDPRWRDPLGHAVEKSQAEHVLERDEPVAPSGQESAEREIGEMSELNLHQRATGGKGALNLAENGRTRNAVETEPGDFVVRRALFGKARHTAGNGDHKPL